MKRGVIKDADLNRPLVEQEQFVKSYAGLFYNPKDPSNLKIFKEQQLFLRIAAQTVPDFAQSLFADSWRVITEWMRPTGALPLTSPARLEYESQLLEAIRVWARRFNIETVWVMIEAWGIVFSGILYVEKAIDPVLAFGTWRRPPEPTRDTRAFQLPAWNPRVETDADYIARADSAWEQLRDGYVAGTKNEMLTAGLKRVPAVRKKQVAAEVRFEWAALRQCTSTPIDDLADLYGVETETIRVSTDRILKGLGFGPRT